MIPGKNDGSLIDIPFQECYSWSNPRWLGCSWGVRPRSNWSLMPGWFGQQPIWQGKIPIPFCSILAERWDCPQVLRIATLQQDAVIGSNENHEISVWGGSVSGEMDVHQHFCRVFRFRVFSHLHCCSFPLPKLSELTITLKKYTETYVFLKAAFHTLYHHSKNMATSRPVDLFFILIRCQVRTNLAK